MGITACPFRFAHLNITVSGYRLSILSYIIPFLSTAFLPSTGQNDTTIYVGFWGNLSFFDLKNNVTVQRFKKITIQVLRCQWKMLIFSFYFYFLP